MMIITEARYRFTVARVRLSASEYLVFSSQELTPCVIRVSEEVNTSTLSLLDVSRVLLVMSVCLSPEMMWVVLLVITTISCLSGNRTAVIRRSPPPNY